MTVDVQILRFGRGAVDDEELQGVAYALLSDQFRRVKSHVPDKKQNSQISITTKSETTIGKTIDKKQLKTAEINS